MHEWELSWEKGNTEVICSCTKPFNWFSDLNSTLPIRCSIIYFITLTRRHCSWDMARIPAPELLNCNVPANNLLPNPPHRSYPQFPLFYLYKMLFFFLFCVPPGDLMKNTLLHVSCSECLHFLPVYPVIPWVNTIKWFGHLEFLLCYQQSNRKRQLLSAGVCLTYTTNLSSCFQVAMPKAECRFTRDVSLVLREGTTNWPAGQRYTGAYSFLLVPVWTTETFLWCTTSGRLHF